MSDQQKHPLKWSNEINLGHVLQLLGIFGMATVWFFSLDARIEQNSTRMEAVIDRMDRTDSTVQRQYDILLDEIRMIRQELRESRQE